MLAQQIREVLAVKNPDLVVVDQMFPVVLLEAHRFGRPSVAVGHTCVWRGLEMSRKLFAEYRLRGEAISRDLVTVDGARGAADEIEALLRPNAVVAVR